MEIVTGDYAQGVSPIYVIWHFNFPFWLIILLPTEKRAPGVTAGPAVTWHGQI